MRLHSILFGLGSFLSLTIPSSAIVIDRTCGPWGATVEAAFTEALDMAKNAVELLNAPNFDSPRVQNLLYALLGGRDRPDLIARSLRAGGYLATIADFAKVTPDYAIYCDDKFIVQQPNGQWVNTRDNAVIDGFFGCDASGWLAYSHRQNAIVICPQYQKFLADKQMPATIGLFRNRDLPSTDELDKYMTLSGTLVHELLHSSQTLPQIVDQPYTFAGGRTVTCYGFPMCYLLAEQDVSTDPPSNKALLNADNLALLAVGLYLKMDFGTGNALADTATAMVARSSMEMPRGMPRNLSGPEQRRKRYSRADLDWLSDLKARNGGTLEADGAEEMSLKARGIDSEVAVAA
ncbi:MAG: hypothetical protein M1817_000034 [Caeruleum heppii]|nr:MAG: hypothetical protein M1817_000034 [Caeruleum heppii]